MVARFANSWMKELFSLITTCAFAPAANANTTRHRKTCFMETSYRRRDPRSSFPTLGARFGFSPIPEDHFVTVHGPMVPSSRGYVPRQTSGAPGRDVWPPQRRQDDRVEQP